MRAALAAYEAERSVEVLKLQNAARNSTEWFENVDRYTSFDAMQFAYSLLTRSQRISHENLRLRDAGFVARAEGWFAERAHAGAGRACAAADVHAVHAARPDARRTASSSRRWRSTRASTALPDDYYLVHLGSRAHGGAGLVFTEMTCVAADARISPGCAGLYDDAHVDGMAAHRRLRARATPTAKIALQLGHAGPKGSTQLGWEDADEPLAAGQLAADRAVGHCVRPAQPGAARDDARTTWRACRGEFVAATRARDRVRLRLARAPLRARLPAVGVPVSADEPSHRRVRRHAREPLPLSARGLSRDAGGMAGGAADVGAHFRARLGSGRQHARTTRSRSRGCSRTPAPT